MDSWEEHDEGSQPPPPPPRHNYKPPGFSFNPNASTFAFNPNASTYAPPSFAPPPPPPPRDAPVYAQPPPPPPPPREAQPTPTPPPPPEPQVAAPVQAIVETVEDLPEDPVIAASGSAASAVQQQPPTDTAEETADSQAPAAAESTTNGLEETAERLSKIAVDTIPEPEGTEDEKDLMKAYELLTAEDPRDHMNIVFTGHVDSGKSTLAGQILLTTGNVDQRTVEKYEREAKENNREAWYMAYIMDTNEEEREKGITVEAGRAYFETPKRRYTILDAPGHKTYVPNMIVAASQADVAVLVISARKGEFEAGSDRGGQTREHAQLAKTLGAIKLIVVVNKLDDHTVCLEGGVWDKKRYDQIVDGLTPFFKQCGFNVKKDVIFLPIAALFGKNIEKPVNKTECPWYDGPTLFQVLDSVEMPERNPLASFRMPIVDKMKEMGSLYLIGKSEQGFVRVGDTLQVMPNKQRVKVEMVFRDEKESNGARAGENLRLKILGADEGDIQTGFVLSSIRDPVPAVTMFEAQIRIVEVLDHLKVFTVGYKSVLHIHTITEECEMVKLLAEIDPKTGEEKKVKFIKANSIAKIRLQVEKPICIEAFGDVPGMGRFTLRDEGRTIAIGKVTKLPKNH